jgi:AcrR family transcriptional regulator
VSTRARITQAALRFFNEQGTAAVSTNHMADALGISPGNLYYHFRNKAEISRALRAAIRGRKGPAFMQRVTQSCRYV